MEFALVSPVLLAVVVGAVEMGRAAYTQGVVSFAAEEATRYAMVNYTVSEDDVRQPAQGCLLGVDPDRIDAIGVTGPVDRVDNMRNQSFWPRHEPSAHQAPTPPNSPQQERLAARRSRGKVRSQGDLQQLVRQDRGGHRRLCNTPKDART